MSTFRRIVANGMVAGHTADELEIETTPTIATPGITFTVYQTDPEGDPIGGSTITISLADGREVAGWLIEHCVTGEPFASGADADGATREHYRT